MIAPLRRRHRWMITGLACVVPMVVFAALSQRPGVDLQRPATVPASAPEPGQQQVLESLFDDPSLEGRLWQEAGAAVLQVTASAAPTRPDPLVYWSPSAPAVTLPADAVLLGPLPSRGPRLYELPPGADGGSFLILYSLAHQEVVSQTPLPTLGAIR